MARLPLNKATLTGKKRDLSTYRRFLPSLDLKRRQLLEARRQSRAALDDLLAREARLKRRIGEDLPMLSNRRVRVEGLVRVADVRLGEANVAGLRVPVLEGMEIARAPYGLLARPHWVDRAVERLEAALRLALAVRVERARLERIEAALRTVTQRVNLFEKRLIPETEAEIARISIALEDAERAGVVRAKVAKRKAGAR
jgi:V/A-type H+-transporting ATPase subunit D